MVSVVGVRVVLVGVLDGAGADAITQALSEQTVVVAGTAAAEQVLPKLAASLRQTWDQRCELAAQVERSLMLTLLPRS